jgi:hypothetical protein
MLPPAEAPYRPARPSSVTVAFWLQLAVVVVLLLLIGLLIWHAVHWDAKIDRAARAVPDAHPAEVDSERFGNVIMSSMLGGLALLPAIGLAVTAPFVRQGHNAARILVFVAAGVPVLFGIGPGCVGAAFIPLAFVAAPPVEEPPPGSGTDGGWPESEFLNELYGNPDPADDTFLAAGWLGAGMVFVLIVAVVLLLALPPANRYFRPRPGPAAGLSPVAAQPFPYVLHPAGYGVHGVPPGYLICPDPAVHLAQRPTGADPSQSQPPQTPPYPPTS